MYRNGLFSFYYPHEILFSLDAGYNLCRSDTHLLQNTETPLLRWKLQTQYLFICPNLYTKLYSIH